jgi:calmodulin
MSDASELSPEAVRRYRETFDLFDQDGSGAISARELATVMRNLGHESATERSAAAMITDVDANGNGEIDFDEFLTLMARNRDGDARREALRETFDRFDTNGDGFISAHELTAAMRAMDPNTPQDDIDDMLRAADLDGDGQISFDEFARMMS